MAPRALVAMPTAGLGHWPTPLERCPRLREALGGLGRCPDIWVKREDASGLALGGNKVRKLDHIFGQALADGVDVAITFGALQSNHARQTAAACRKLGLDCELILTRMVDRRDDLYERSGNVLLDELLGATLHVVDDADAAARVHAERVAALEADGRRVITIPFGGSDVTGALGYVAATEEWAAQAARAGLGFGFDRVVLASSTGGTYAGTLVGVKKNGLKTHVTGVCVYADVAATEAVIAPLLVGAAEALGIGAPPPGLVDVTDEFLGEGYGVPSDAMIEALALFARTEGLLLDPVYSGKAAAGLIAMVRRGEIPPAERVLFLHTGGTPGLFAYGDAVLPDPTLDR
jgi:D-cysteine desulfhydrase family pyridoxal phosphate-dependent enzyme